MIAPQHRLRVKQRLAVVAYALAHGLKWASRRFGLDRKPVRAMGASPAGGRGLPDGRDGVGLGRARSGGSRASASPGWAEHYPVQDYEELMGGRPRAG